MAEFGKNHYTKWDFSRMGKQTNKNYAKVNPPPPPPIPNGWDCEITAHQSQAPYAPIYGCVEKFAPQVGQYPTQQDCINSHCGSPEPVTVQCSQCNNGFAVSNIFPGTSCPQGWQLASLGDPCKPPIDLIPTDPIIYD